MRSETAITHVERFPKRSFASVESDAEVQDWVESIITPILSSDCIGIGNYARVYAQCGSGPESGLAVKDARYPAFHAENAVPREELRLQESAFEILEEARASGEDVARVPKPIAYVEANVGGELKHLLVMERVVGKTFFRLAIEHLAHHDDRFTDLRSDAAAMPDADLEDEILIRLALNGRPPRVQLANIFGASLASGFRLPQHTFLQIVRAQLALNRRRLYHRDLHPKNVMIDDAGVPYLIDFGKAARASLHGSSSEVYEDYIGEQRVVYQPDAEIGHLLKPFTEPVP